MRIDPNDGDIIGNRGIYHLFHGEPGAAIEWLDKVLDLHADTPHTVDIMRFWKALALFTAADYASAVTVLGSTSGLDFLKAELLAACHARLGQTDQARARAAEVLRAWPEFRVAGLRLWKVFRNEADGRHLRDALRDAGLPD
jgi:adenylate cyclase